MPEPNAPPRAAQVPDGVRVGETYLEAKNYAQAERYFHSVLAKDGGQVRALNGLGVCYQERDRDLFQAAAFFRNAVLLDPGYLKARRNLIVVLLEQNEVYQAFDEYVAGLKHDPKNGRLRLEYADLLATKLRYPEVIAQCRQILADAGDDLSLFDDAIAFLRGLKLPGAAKLADEFAGKRPRQGADPKVFIGAAVLLAAAIGGWVYTRGPGQKLGPDILCSRFVAGTPVAGLAQASREAQIARAAVYDPGGRILFDKTLPAMRAQDWKAFQELLGASEGRAVFGSPPSISVNRWCTVNFSAGKVTSALSMSHAP